MHYLNIPNISGEKMRKRPGAAYEQCPAEKTGFWISKNFLKLLSSLIASAVFCFIMNWLVDGFFNFLATDGKEVFEKPFSSHSPTWKGVKLVGSLIIIFFMCKKRK